uniref:Uncharacterized protein n=1 Tax=Anguilla anguilla TaxID=7936 RepID=A0A0E9Y2J8_ANGAN
MSKQKVLSQEEEKQSLTHLADSFLILNIQKTTTQDITLRFWHNYTIRTSDIMNLSPTGNSFIV